MTASVSNWVGLASLVFLSACGGRTSMLTDDNEPSLGGAVPGNSAGGAAGSSTAPAPTSAPAPSTSPVGPGMMVGGGGVTGTGGTGVAGGTSAGGVTGTGGSPAITPACADFCKRVQGSPCADELGIEAGSCTSDCTRSLGTDACAPSAKAVLDCYSQVFTVNASHCAVLGDQLERKCGKQAYAFQSCADGAQSSPPSPPPGPRGCSGSGSGSATSCSLSSMCDDGSFYAISCNETPGEQAQCSCISSAGMNLQVTLNESASNACFDAAASCGVPDLGGSIPVPK